MESTLRRAELIPIRPEENTGQEKNHFVNQKSLINKLNLVNFKEGKLQLNFKHNKYNHTIPIKASPLPCTGNRLECTWHNPAEIQKILKSYTFQDFLLTDHHPALLVTPTVLGINEKSIIFQLPETCSEFSSRKVRRNPCKDVKIQFIQNSAAFDGELIDFSPASFRVVISAVPPQTFQWINPTFPVTLIISDNSQMIYSGECRIIKQSHDQRNRAFVLKPINRKTGRFRAKEFRSTRHQLLPSPNISFKHPLTQKWIDLEVMNLSGTGFLVQEDQENSALLPGMVIPELELSFANIFSVKCKAQVIYRNLATDMHQKPRINCGLAILDMGIQDHVMILSLINQANNSNSYLCNRVDMDALWSFFFDTGFIYPEKYAFIEANKEHFKETYKKLYTKHPSIARHFIYQDKGVILGHMSMLRFYENTWLIHHHAANKTVSNKAGLVILKQASNFLNDSSSLHSIRMNFVTCYYRPENKFPNKVFGGAAKHIGNSKGCSIDEFAYFHYRGETRKDWNLDESWALNSCSTEDLLELESFYEHTSGGLMINALDLEPGMLGVDEISREYQKFGFKKERHIFSLKKDGILKAIFLVNLSDTGLNMSELTNCIKIIVLDSEELPGNAFDMALSLLVERFGQKGVPVLVYPNSYVTAQSIPSEKIYRMWILSLQYLDNYFKFCNRFFSRL